MDLEKNRMQIEAIKLAIETLPKQEISVRDTVRNSMDWLLQNYTETNNDLFLTQALNQLIAYLELGMEYGSNEEIFDRVLNLCQLDKEALIFQYGKMDKRLLLTKNRIKTIIRRWRQGFEEDFTLNEVVDDIYARMLRKECGKQLYVSHYKDGRIFNMYELIISAEEHVLHDILKKKYYFFEVEK